MEPHDRTRLTKLLGMTGSAHDGEALAAIRLAGQHIRALGLTWAEALEPSNGKQIPDARDALRKAREAGFQEGYVQGLREGRASAPRPRPRAWRVIVEQMLGMPECITEWETKFLQSFLYGKWHSPTARQHAVMEQIAAKCGITDLPEEPVAEPW